MVVVAIVAFASADVTDVTVPVAELVPAPIAVRKVAASKALTVLSALNLGKVIAEGFAIENKLLPKVVAPKLVRCVAALSVVIVFVPDILRKLIADGLVRVNKLLPTVVAPKLVLEVAALPTSLKLFDVTR